MYISLIEPNEFVFLFKELYRTKMHKSADLMDLKSSYIQLGKEYIRNRYKSSIYINSLMHRPSITVYTISGADIEERKFWETEIFYIPSYNFYIKSRSHLFQTGIHSYHNNFVDIFMQQNMPSCLFKVTNEQIVPSIHKIESYMGAHPEKSKINNVILNNLEKVY